MAPPRTPPVSRHTHQLAGDLYAAHVLLVDASGVPVVFGSGGTSSADGSAYTQDTTVGTPMLGAYVAAGRTIVDGDLAVPAIDATGAILVTGAVGSTQYNRDTVAGATDSLTMSGGVRKDTAATLVGTDGDRTAPIYDANGRLHVIPTLPSGAATETTVSAISGDIGDTADAATLVGDSAGTIHAKLRFIANALENIDGNSGVANQILGTSTYTEAGSVGRSIAAVRRDADTTLVNTTNEFGPLQMDANGRLKVEAFSGETLPISLATMPALVASSANIGDVDVLSIVPGTAATNLGKAEDGAHTSGDVGVMMLAVRQDSQVDFGADGDYVPLSIDADGGIRVSIIAGAGSGTALADDADFVDGTTSGTPIGGVAEAASPTTVTEGDFGWAAITLNRAVKVCLYNSSGTELTPTNDADHDAAAVASGPQIMFEAKDQDGSALPVTVAEGDAVRGAASMSGVQYVMAVNEDGSAVGTVVLGAGTAAFGKLAANSGVDIGDVDVTTVITGTGATNLGKAVDGVAGATDTGVLLLAVRDDSLASLTPADGDYTQLRVNSTGALHVTGGGGGTEYVVNAPAPADPTGATFTMERDDALSALAEVEGDWTNPRASANGALWVAVDALPASTNTLEVVGDVAHDAAAAGNPVLIAGYASAAAPSDVSGDADAVRAWRLRNGAAATVITAAGALIGGDAANGLDVDITRLPASTNTLEVVGDAAHDAAVAGNPVLVGARASAAVPTDVSADNDAVELWALRSGALATQPTFGGVLAVAGNGSVGTGVQRVTIADDSTGILAKVSALGISTTGPQKAEDVAAVTGDMGVAVWGVRVDSPNATPTSTDGDYGQISTDRAGGVRTALYETDFAVLGTKHVKKYYTNAGAVTDGIIWSSAAGTRWYVTDIFINVSAAATVTLEDDLAGGDVVLWKAELAANSGWSHHFGTPLFSGEDAADLMVTTSAGNVYITVTGYEI